MASYMRAMSFIFFTSWANQVINQLRQEERKGIISDGRKCCRKYGAETDRGSGALILY